MLGSATTGRFAGTCSKLTLTVQSRPRVPRASTTRAQGTVAAAAALGNNMGDTEAVPMHAYFKSETIQQQFKLRLEEVCDRSRVSYMACVCTSATT